MHEMIAHFKKDVMRAIDRYTAQFVPQPVPLWRSKDVIELKALLARPYTHINDCIYALKARLTLLKTGPYIPFLNLWLWSSGESQLRTSINRVIADYRKPVMQRLLTEMNQVAAKHYALLAQQVTRERAQTKGRIPCQSASTSTNLHSNPIDFESRYRKLKKNNQRLAADNRRLATENRQLRARVHSLERAARKNTHVPKTLSVAGRKRRDVADSQRLSYRRLTLR